MKVKLQIIIQYCHKNETVRMAAKWCNYKNKYLSKPEQAVWSVVGLHIIAYPSGDLKSHPERPVDLDL